MSKKLVHYDDVYLCDPEKRVNCPGRHKKDWCGVECFLTRDIKQAKDPVTKLTFKQMEAEYKRRTGVLKEEKADESV